MCASSPCKDLAMSMNPSRCIGFHAAGLSGGVSTHCVKIFGMSVLWLGAVCAEVVIVEVMTRGLEHPRKGGLEKNDGNGLSDFCFGSIPLWLPGSPLPPLWNILKNLSSSKVGGSLARMSICKGGQWLHSFP